MPSPTLDLDNMEEMSIQKIHKQIDYLVANRMPGLLSGFSSKEIGEKENGRECCNTTLHWLAGGNDNTEERAGCEVCFRLCYAGRPLSVRLMFTPRQPWMPPDLLIDDARFMDALSLDLINKELNSLERWPQAKENAVSELIDQLYILYKKFQVACLKLSHSDLRSQYELFESDMKIREEDLEVLVTPSEQVLCVRLPLELEDLPASLFTEHRGLATCVLHFASSANLNSFLPTLRLSPRAESLLCGGDSDGGADSVLRLPPISPGCSSLSAYALTIVQLVKDRVKQLHHALEIRKQIVAQLLCQYDAAISQYDRVQFYTIELLLQEEDFHYLVDIVFPYDFPQACGPRVQLRSICQQEGEEPISAKVPGVTTTAASDPDSVLQAVLRAVTSYAPTFRRQCNTRCFLSSR